MTETASADDFYRGQVRTLVWSGFFNELDFEQYLEDASYDDEAAPLIPSLRAFGLVEIERKREAEAGWPAETDCDRLDACFARLDTSGVLALANAGNTSSDASGDAWEIIESVGTGAYRGFCFYHGQDVERAVLGQPLFIGFDAVEQTPEAKRAVGEDVRNALSSAGFTVVWNEDPETRMTVRGLDWKRRTPWEGGDTEEAVEEAATGGFFRRLFGR